MHEMMDAVHGSGTSESMHKVDGGEQVMEECSQMHEQMQDMMGSRDDVREHDGSRNDADDAAVMTRFQQS